MALTEDLWVRHLVSRLFYGLCFNNLLFSFQKVRAASAGALPKRRNSKLFLGNSYIVSFSVISLVTGMNYAGLNTAFTFYFPDSEWCFENRVGPQALKQLWQLERNYSPASGLFLCAS